MQRAQSFFFDLDGTLCDSRPGLTYSFIAAFNALGVTDADELDVDRFLGTPLPEAFRSVVATISEGGVKRGIKAFRQAYEDRGIFQTPLYDGAKEMLAQLSTFGAQVWLVTSKPEKYAQRVLENLHIASFFNGVVGASLNETETKTDLLKVAIARSRADVTHALMLGDRAFDITAAINCGVLPVGALWGYGSQRELKEAGCNEFCESLQAFQARFAPAVSTQMTLVH